MPKPGRNCSRATDFPVHRLACPPLTSNRFRQAVAWADYFSGLGLDVVCCSDLIRCRVTADIISARFSLEPRAFPELREVCPGAWEGKSFERVQTLHPHDLKKRGEHLADHRPPGGESFRDLQNRTWPLFEAVVRRLQGLNLLQPHQVPSAGNSTTIPS